MTSWTNVTLVYPSINWQPKLFIHLPQGFWKDKNNRKEFVDDLAKQLKISSYKDWVNVTRKEFIQHGGRGLLKYFDESPKKVLQGVYPEVNWNSFHFRNTKSVKYGYWTNFSNRVCSAFRLSHRLEIVFR